MLNREKEAINQMFAAAYEKVDQQRLEVEGKARTTAITALMKTVDWQSYAKIVCESLGWDQKQFDEVMANTAGTVGGYGTPAQVGPSRFHQMWEKAGIPNPPKPTYWGASETHSIVNVALNTSNKKWDAISAAVYDFALSPKANHAEFEKAVKVFLDLL